MLARNSRDGAKDSTTDNESWRGIGSLRPGLAGGERRGRERATMKMMTTLR